MAFNSITSVAQILNPDMIGRIGQTLGLDKASTLKAVAAAVPSILGGFAAKASTPDGARQLSETLAAQDPALLGQLGGMYGGAQQAAVVDYGVGSLGQMLDGPANGKLMDAVSQYAGIDKSATKSLLGMVAPVVMGSLAQQQQAEKLDAGGLASMLAGQKDIISAALPGGFASMLGDTARVASVVKDAVPAVEAVRTIAGKVDDLVKGGVTNTVGATVDAARAAAGRVGGITGVVTSGVAAAVAKVVPADISASAPVTSTIAGRTGDLVKGTQTIATGTAAVETARRVASKVEETVRGVPAREKVEVAGSTGRIGNTTATPNGSGRMAVEPTRASYDESGESGWPDWSRWAALIPVLLVVLGSIWWSLNSIERTRLAAATEQTRIATATRLAAEAKAKVDAEAAAVRLAAEVKAKAEADATAARLAAVARMEADAKAKADADATAARLASAARMEAEAKAKADADAAAAKLAAAARMDAEAKAKADADATATKLAAAARMDAEAKAKADADAAATRLAAETKAKADAAAALQACQTSVTAAAGSGPIRFATASATLDAASTPTLDRLVAAIRACPSARVRIEGHTDGDGDINRNQLLSENRAKSVTEYLVKAGIESNRLTSAGFGPSKPLAPNDSKENKLKNRRIEFAIDRL